MSAEERYQFRRPVVLRVVDGRELAEAARRGADAVDGLIAANYAGESERIGAEERVLEAGRAWLLARRELLELPMRASLHTRTLLLRRVDEALEQLADAFEELDR